MKYQSAEAEKIALNSLITELNIADNPHPAMPRRRSVAATALGAAVCLKELNAEHAWLATEALIKRSVIEPAQQPRIDMFQQLGEIVCTQALPMPQNVIIARHLLHQLKTEKNGLVRDEISEQLEGMVEAGVPSQVFQENKALGRSAGFSAGADVTGTDLSL